MAEATGKADNTGGIRYHGHPVLRVERERVTVGRYQTSFWYAVVVGDNGDEAKIAISPAEADQFGAQVETVEVAS